MSLSLNGTTGLIAIPTGWTSPIAAFTYAFWFYINALPAAYAGLADNTSGGLVLLLKATGKLANYGPSPGGDPITGSPTFSTGQWYHFAHTYSNIAAALYSNGSAFITSAGGTAATFSGTIWHGNDVNNTPRFFNGIFADIGHWNTILSATEVLALSRGVRAQTIRPNNLVRCMPLDGYGAPAIDIARYKRPATVTGATLKPDPPLLMERNLPDLLPGIRPFAVRAPGTTAIFQAWARGSNIPVIGAGTF